MEQATTRTGGQFKEKLKGLKVRVVALQKQAGELEERAGRLVPTGQRKVRAVVARSRCTGCEVLSEQQQTQSTTLEHDKHR